jgi:hypothetical protein
LLQQIDAVLDLSGIRRAFAPYYAAGGRPWVDPELISLRRLRPANQNTADFVNGLLGPASFEPFT